MLHGLLFAYALLLRTKRKADARHSVRRQLFPLALLIGVACTLFLV